MSRYTIHRGNLEFVYGYDRPLNEYFYQIFDHDIDDADQQLIEWKSNRTDYMARDYYAKGLTLAEIALKFHQFGVPKNVVDCVSLGIPIPDSSY